MMHKMQAYLFLIALGLVVLSVKASAFGFSLFNFTLCLCVTICLICETHVRLEVCVRRVADLHSLKFWVNNNKHNILVQMIFQLKKQQ